MQILIGCAKDMSATTTLATPFVSQPRFQQEAEQNAVQMIAYSPSQLQELLKISPALALEVWNRYQSFLGNEGKLPAIHAYTGVVYKALNLSSFTKDAYRYVQEHLWITSFLYGLLHPLDAIKPYRLEGKIVLPDNGKTMFAYWKPLLTDMFIDSIKTDDGILVDLASNDMRSFFDWKRVEREVTVIKPDFLVEKGGIVKNVTVYAKMMRGAMTSHIIPQQLNNPEELKLFDADGFCYHGDGQDEYNPVFIKSEMGNVK